MATQYGVFKALMKKWCEQNKCSETDFWEKVGGQWGAERMARHWNERKVMHPRAREFLYKEV